MIRPVAADGRIETGGAFTPILRPRVVDRIASAATQRIVLIIAPAGYGKSVALRQYLATLDVEQIRYDVRPDHGNLLGFARGFADALLDVAPDARKTVSDAYEKTRTSKHPGADLAMWLHAHIKTFTGVVAIDDLHVCENDPQITELLISLVDRTKGRVQWVMASRSALDLPIGTWMAYNQMDLNIDERDLGFTLEEARQAAKATRVAVRDEELTQILAMTEGWPTAVNFALRTSTRSVDLRNIVASTREMTYRYLAEQVYHSLDPSERELLQFVCFLPELDAQVMRAAGYENSTVIIESLRDRVSFLYPERPGVYRCHDLFREFLRHQLELQGDVVVEQTRQRAAAALEASGRIAAALTLYAEAQRDGDVLRLLEDSGFRLIDRGHADSLEVAIESLPRDLRANHPVVLGLRALTDAHAGQYDRAESLLNRAISRSSNRKLSAMLAVRLANIMLNLRRDIVPLLEPFVEETLPISTRAELMGLLAAGYAYGGRDLDALRAIEVSEAIASETDDLADRAKVLHRIGGAAMILSLPAAQVERYLTSAADLAAKCGLYTSSARSNATLAMYSLFYEEDMTRCAWYAQQAITAATKIGDRIALQTALGYLAEIECTRGNGERLRSLQRQFAESATTDPVRVAYAVPWRALALAWDGRFDEAHRLLSSVLDRIFYDFDRAYIGAACALLLVVSGEIERGTALSRSVVKLTQVKTKTTLVHARRQFELARLLCAAAEALAGRPAVAAHLIDRSKRTSVPVVSAMRGAVSTLCRAIKDPTLRSDVVEQFEILDTMGYGGMGKLMRAVAEKGLDAISSSPPPMENGNTLTKGEVAVLRALSEGRSTKEIAADMGCTVGTVQVHIKRAIRKLQCSGRSEALQEARKIGVLG